MGESSKPTMESTETSAMPEATTVGTSPISNFDQDSKLLAPIPSRVLGHPVVGKALAACSNSNVVVSAPLRWVSRWAQSPISRLLMDEAIMI